MSALSVVLVTGASSGIGRVAAETFAAARLPGLQHCARPTAEATALFDANVSGMLCTTRAVLPYMREQRRGRIVNVSSVFGVLPAPCMGMYAATKHAVEGLSESLDHEVRQFGIPVTLCSRRSPGPTLTSTGPARAPRSRTTAANATRSSAQWPKAALGPWRMCCTPLGQAFILTKLRRFMPSGPVDASLRKKLGLT